MPMGPTIWIFLYGKIILVLVFAHFTNHTIFLMILAIRHIANPSNKAKVYADNTSVR